MMEAALNHLGGGRIQASSAGSHPTGVVHPKSIELLESKGISTQGLRSKSWDEFAGTAFDVVITVCDQAAGESCPVFFGVPVKLHWGVPDPAHATGSDDDITAAFRHSYGLLEGRVKVLLDLPFETLGKQELKDKLGAITGLNSAPKRLSLK